LALRRIRPRIRAAISKMEKRYFPNLADIQAELGKRAKEAELDDMFGRCMSMDHERCPSCGEKRWL
jgi:hypothetical protein